MGVSFRVSRRGRRFYPSPPPPAAAAATADRAAPPTAATPDGDDLEPSFALNLFQDGYSISDPSKGMLLFLVGDDPEKRPYSRASEALFSDIEHGCLPQVILGDMPCKFVNGTIVCEVRDYRPFLSNAGDSSGDDFPVVNRVSLRLGTEHVLKDLASIVNASWTYHNQLIAESTIICALQPRLNLDPTPCLERLQNSVKKIDLGLNKARKQTKATCIDNTSAGPPENCKPKEFITCEGAVVCIENEAQEGLPHGIFNSLSTNCPPSLKIMKARSPARSDPDNAIQYSSTLMNSSASCNKKQSASCTPAPDLLLQSQQAQVATLQPQRETVQPQNRKEHSNLPREIHEHQNCRPSNKYTRLSSENTRCHLLESIRTSNNKGLNLVSPKLQPVRVKLDQTTHSKDMRVQQQKALSEFTANCPHPSLDTTKLCVEKILEEVDSSTIRLKDRNLVSTVDPDNYGVADLRDRRTTSVTTCSSSSREAPSKPPKAAIEPQPTSSKRKGLGDYISLNQEIGSKEKRQKNGNTPCENGSSEEPDVIGSISSQLGISPDIESCIGDPSYSIEPVIEKIPFEVILTSQRHGLSERAANINDLERSWPLPPSNFFLPENTAQIACTQNEIMPYYPTGRIMNTRKIRKLTFHPVQHFCRGVVDECHYTLSLLESEAPDDHQISVETIYGDERIYISTLPTSHHANKLVDQFILLMRRDGYTLCNDLREQYEDAPQQGCLTGKCPKYPWISTPELGYLTGERPQHPWLSSPTARSVVIKGSNNVGCSFHNRPAHVHANAPQQRMQAQQCTTLPSVQTNFCNPHHPGQQHYTSGILDQGGLFANRVLSMDLDQYQAVQQCQGVGLLASGELYQPVQQSQEVVSFANGDQYQAVQQRQGVGLFANGEQYQPVQQRQGVGLFANGDRYQPVEQRQGVGLFAHGEQYQPVQRRQGIGLFPNGDQYQPAQQRQRNGLCANGDQYQPVQQRQGVGLFAKGDPHQPVQQHQGIGLFPNRMLPIDLGQYHQPVQQRQGDGQCSQCRHNTPPGFSQRNITNTSKGSYNQWRQVSTPHGGKVYQWDLPAFDRGFCSCPQLHPVSSGTPLSTLYPVGSPPLSSQSFGSDDGSVTSTPVQLQVPLGYQQYMSHGVW
uniref:Uncharacterized protein n=1 Tax=Leersia perrieri TaxID=77586 RepID=A0A0D9UW44_9ORYZ